MTSKARQYRFVRKSKGFTIVELLIVIVVIGILAAIVIVAYNGVKARADEASLQSEVSQLNKKILAYKSLNNDALPSDVATGGLSVASNHTLYYRVTPDGKNFCLASSMQNDPLAVFSVTSTQGIAKKGTCEGYVLVPGNPSLGTSDFWVMKYEAKNVNGKAISQATNAPWAYISQLEAISASIAACDGCRLISEAEWMTIAANTIGVTSNWSSGVVGSGYIYSGHSDSSPNNSLAAGTDDANGYANTGNSAPSAQRRTLTLSNGEVIWDIAGNLQESTQGVLLANALTGVSGDTNCSWHEWTDGGFSWGAFPSSSRPGTISATVGAWTSALGVGRMCTYYSNTDTRSISRGGAYTSSPMSGVLAVYLGNTPSASGYGLGFRVTR